MSPYGPFIYRMKYGYDRKCQSPLQAHSKRHVWISIDLEMVLSRWMYHVPMYSVLGGYLI